MDYLERIRQHRRLIDGEVTEEGDQYADLMESSEWHPAEAGVEVGGEQDKYGRSYFRPREGTDVPLGLAMKYIASAAAFAMDEGWQLDELVQDGEEVKCRLCGALREEVFDYEEAERLDEYVDHRLVENYETLSDDELEQITTFELEAARRQALREIGYEEDDEPLLLGGNIQHKPDCKYWLFHNWLYSFAELAMIFFETNPEHRPEDWHYSVDSDRFYRDKHRRQDQEEHERFMAEWEEKRKAYFIDGAGI